MNWREEEELRSLLIRINWFGRLRLVPQSQMKRKRKRQVDQVRDEECGRKGRKEKLWNKSFNLFFSFSLSSSSSSSTLGRGICKTNFIDHVQTLVANVHLLAAGVIKPRGRILKITANKMAIKLHIILQFR